MELMLHIRDHIISNHAAWKKLLNEIDEGSYFVKFEPRKKRTHNQNNFYWGCIVPIVKDGLRDVGFDDVKTPDDAHTVLKSLFLRKRIANHKTGEVIEMIGSTTELTTVEFNAFIEDIAKWSAEYLSCVIPEPGQQTYLNLQ